MYDVKPLWSKFLVTADSLCSGSSWINTYGINVVIYLFLFCCIVFFLTACIM